MQAVTGITIDAPEPAPGESLFASVLGKAADIISGKNSDLPKIEAAYMGLSATPQAATESYDLTELEKILAEQQPTAPALTDEQQGTATAAPASEAAPSWSLPRSTSSPSTPQQPRRTSRTRLPKRSRELSSNWSARALSRFLAALAAA